MNDITNETERIIDRNIIEKNEKNTGCTMTITAKDIHEIFTCDKCEHK